MGKMIDSIKRQEQLALNPQEFMASLIWYYVVKGNGHFFKTHMHNIPCWIEYSHEMPDDPFMIDVYYLHQEHSFMLVQPTYSQALAVAPEVLSWLESVYASSCPMEPVHPQKKKARRSIAGRQQRPQPSITNQASPQQIAPQQKQEGNK